ncbi:MAG: hypothetical protein QM756_40215 [Polyangiaceae bacterium]
MVTFGRYFALACLGLAHFSCRPDTEGGASLVDSPRVLAIRSEPAEVAPGKSVNYSALFVGPSEELDAKSLDWALCLARKPIAVAGSISLECLKPEADADVLTPLGNGVTATGTLPKDGCRVFGPSPPAPKAGEPAARPADPDSSGGYYQPLRLRSPDSEAEYAAGFTRIACGVGGATQEQSVDYAKRYRDNENPEVEAVTIDPGVDDTRLSESAAAPTRIVAGARLKFRASWPECPVEANCGDGICSSSDDRDACAEDCATPHGCKGSEPYVYLDPIQRSIVERRESMRASWFTTAGSFEHDRSGRSEGEAAIAYSDNTWVAPKTPGPVRFWVVLRDDRGGVGYKGFFASVE